MSADSSFALVARTPPSAHRRQPRARYGLALLLAVLGVVASVACSMFGQSAQSRHAAGFVRAAVPGQVSVQVDRPATYFVYAEGTLWLKPSVQVTDPAGNAVPVVDIAPETGFLHSSNGGAFAKFGATTTGDYRIAVATGTTAQGEFSVGDRLPMWLRWSDVTSFVLLALGVVAGGVLAIVTWMQRRRRNI